MTTLYHNKESNESIVIAMNSLVSCKQFVDPLCDLFGIKNFNKKTVWKEENKQLYLSFGKGNITIVEVEIPSNKNIKIKDKFEALCIGTRMRNLQFVLKLLRTGINPNIVEISITGENPLHIASREGFIEIATALIKDGGADIDLQDMFGYTPLHVAVNYEKLEMVKKLIKLEVKESSKKSSINNIFPF